MKLSELNSKLEQASYTDTLTSLHNRRYLNNWLDIVTNEHTETLQPLQVILIDLDNFKQINDQLGHLVGDKILVAMANLLKQEVRVQIILCVGGEKSFCDPGKFIVLKRVCYSLNKENCKFCLATPR